MAQELAKQLAVYLVADPEQTPLDLPDVVAAALRGGVTAVQLRAKSLTDREQLALARVIRAHCTAFNALFLVNDRVDIALASDADGVHLGVDDLPLADARRLLGPARIVGFSPETDDQAAAASALGADYLGVGPVFGTVSKADAGSAIGLEAVARRAELSRIPIIGIGGITSDNAPDVIAAGAVGVAVVGAILRASDPADAARRLALAVHARLEHQSEP